MIATTDALLCAVRAVESAPFEPEPMRRFQWWILYELNARTVAVCLEEVLRSRYFDDDLVALNNFAAIEFASNSRFVQIALATGGLAETSVPLACSCSIIPR